MRGRGLGMPDSTSPVARQITMIRRLTFALGLGFAFAAGGCQGTENVTGSPTGAAEGRTLASMLPEIRKSLTPQIAEEKFGNANTALGSGLVILVYNVEDGKKVNLAFPGPTALISYASWTDKSGAVTDIPLRD
jgi:hypothetical protein